MNVHRNRARPYPNGWSGVGSRSDSEIETSRNPWLVVSATEWAASASSAADPETRPPTSFVIVTTALAASAISTVRRLAWAVLWVRSTLRRLVRVADGSWRVLTDGGYPVQRIGTPPSPDLR